MACPDRRPIPPHRSISTARAYRKFSSLPGRPSSTNPKDFPWTMPFWPTYALEQKTYVDYILNTKPNAKIAVLYANDDYGKDHLNGIKTALARIPTHRSVAELSYETSDPTIDISDGQPQASGADVSSAPVHRNSRPRPSARRMRSGGRRCSLSPMLQVRSAPC